MKRLIGLTAFGLGYVMGARAGRERYDQLMSALNRVREDPRVQRQAHHVADVAKEKAPGVVEKVTDVASSAVPIHRTTPDAAESAELPAFGERHTA